MKKNDLALDARMIRHSGIGTYVRGLLTGFLEAGTWEQSRPVLFGPGPDAHFPASSEFRWRPFAAPIYSLQEQLQYPSKLKGFGLWHAPHYNAPFFKGRTQLVVTVHDLIHWIFRGRFFSRAQASYTKLMMGRAVRQAARMIAVSEHTKRDLIEHFGADPGKIRVIYEGAPRDFKPCEDPAEISAVREKFALPERFFLYVGLIKPHKNVLWLMRLFRRLFKEKKITAPLVLVGKKDSSYAPEFRELAALGREAAVIYLDQVSKQDLQRLYQGALALVHPSLYEGFGLTLLEAMASGTPAAAFRTASIPEVAGDAAVLTEPNDEEQMAAALQKLESSESFRAGCRQKGMEQIKKFTWKKTAEETLQVYREVLE